MIEAYMVEHSLLGALVGLIFALGKEGQGFKLTSSAFQYLSVKSSKM